MPAIGNKDISARAETKSLLVEMAGYSTVTFLDSWVVWTFVPRVIGIFPVSWWLGFQLWFTLPPPWFLETKYIYKRQFFYSNFWSQKKYSEIEVLCTSETLWAYVFTNEGKEPQPRQACLQQKYLKSQTRTSISKASWWNLGRLNGSSLESEYLLRDSVLVGSPHVYGFYFQERHQILTAKSQEGNPPSCRGGRGRNPS